MGLGFWKLLKNVNMVDLGFFNKFFKRCIENITGLGIHFKKYKIQFYNLIFFCKSYQS